MTKFVIYKILFLSFVDILYQNPVILKYIFSSCRIKKLMTLFRVEQYVALFVKQIAHDCTLHHAVTGIQLTCYGFNPSYAQATFV